MRTSRLLAIELSLVLAGALILFFILANPFSSGDDADSAGAMRGASSPPPITVRATAAPTPVPATPIPDHLRCGPAIDAEYMADTQIVSYYGSPYTTQMGILGELEPSVLIEEVEAKAAEYDALNGVRGTRPALHIVYGTAQPEPGNDGLHLLYVDSETMEEYIELACEHGLLVFIDLQIGHSTVESEVRRALDLLEYPHVHLAIDPEFAMEPGEIPGESIGTVDATDVNAAQAIVEDLIKERGLSDKIVMVHRFTDDMITRSELIEDYERIRLVIDMDGFGPKEIKEVKYGWYAAPGEYRGIKLFFQQDTPLMTEDEVLALDPHVIIYQ